MRFIEIYHFLDLPSCILRQTSEKPRVNLLKDIIISVHLLDNGKK